MGSLWLESFSLNLAEATSQEHIILLLRQKEILNINHILVNKMRQQEVK